MYTYSTPTLPVEITGIDYTDVLFFRIAIRQADLKLVKTVDADDPMVDAEHETVYVPLTQEETACFKDGKVQIQARIKFSNGAVMPTNKATLSVEEVLDEVII